jgi:hypothetical protein
VNLKEDLRFSLPKHPKGAAGGRSCRLSEQTIKANRRVDRMLLPTGKRASGCFK